MFVYNFLFILVLIKDAPISDNVMSIPFSLKVTITVFMGMYITFSLVGSKLEMFQNVKEHF